MPLPQDIVTRIIRVKWAGGSNLIVVLDYEWNRRLVGYSMVAPIRSAQIDGLTGDIYEGVEPQYDGPSINEPEGNNPEENGDLKWNFPPLRDHTSDMEDETYEVIDRAIYYLRNMNTGTIITFSEDIISGVAVPFTIDYTGANEGPTEVVIDGSEPANITAQMLAWNTPGEIGNPHDSPPYDYQPYLSTVLASHNEGGIINVFTGRGLVFNFIKGSLVTPSLEEDEQFVFTIEVDGSMAIPNLRMEYSIIVLMYKASRKEFVITDDPDSPDPIADLLTDLQASQGITEIGIGDGLVPRKRFTVTVDFVAKAIEIEDEDLP